MKIVLVLHQFLPEFIGGTEVLAFQLAKEFTRRRHDIEVFTAFPVTTEVTEKLNFDRIQYKGIPIYRYHHVAGREFPPQNSVEAEYNNLSLSTHFHEYLREFKPDIVHFYHLSRLSASFVSTCRALHIPTVLTPTDFWFVCPALQLRMPDNSFCSGPNAYAVNCLRHLSVYQPKNVQRWLSFVPDWMLRLIIRATRTRFWKEKKYGPRVRSLSIRLPFLIRKINEIDLVLPPTNIMKEILQKNGLREERTCVLPYGINVRALQTMSKTRHDSILRIGYVGQINEHKGVHILVEAIQRLPKDALVLVTIHGDLNHYPAYVAKLRVKIGNDSRVRLCGRFSNQTELATILSNIDVLVVPSLWYENAPVVICEAQAAKVPVIASNTEGIAELIQHNVNGLLFSKGNSAELASHLAVLLDDRKTLDRFTGNSIIPMSVEHHVGELEKCYDEIIQKRKKRN